MPNVNDIVQVAEALGKSPVLVLKDRCAAVRNRNASCRACVGACASGAISIAANEISLDASLCVSCGACSSVCPTEALVPFAPTDAELLKAAANSAYANDGLMVIACARISSKKLADPERYAEVPCLARVEESLLLSLVAHGASEAVLVDGGCATCKYRYHVAMLDTAIRSACALMEAQGCHAPIRRAQAFPEELLVEDATGLFGSTRRGFFSEAAAQAKDTAMTAARATIEQELGVVHKEASIGERLRVTADGSMPRLSMPRHDALINAMDALGEPAAETVRSRRFGCVTVDVQKCNACGMCAVFCSTGALAWGEGSSSREPNALEFSACECVQCGLCRDVCWKGALVLSDTVPLEQLFDFEPVEFDLSGIARKADGLFGRA